MFGVFVFYLYIIITPVLAEEKTAAVLYVQRYLRTEDSLSPWMRPLALPSVHVVRLSYGMYSITAVDHSYDISI